MFRRSATAVVALTATAGLLAGCGSSSSGGNAATSNVSGASAAAELSSALTALGQASTLTASLKLGATGSQFLHFVKSQNKSAHLTADQANVIAGSSINVELAAPSGKTLSDLSSTGGLSKSGAVDISVVDNGKTFFTLRSVNQVVYLQADVKDFLNAIGKSAAYRQIQSAGGQLPSFVGALVQGKWVSLPISTLKALGSSLGAGVPSTTNPTQNNQLLDQLKSLLTKDVTVTKSSSGSTDTLTLTTNLRSFVGDFTTGLAASIPGAGSALSSANLSTVPDKNVSLVATVTSGALASLSFDLGQVAKTAGGTLPIQLSFSRSGPAISAPSGAVAVDLSQLGGLLGAFGGSGSSGSGF